MNPRFFHWSFVFIFMAFTVVRVYFHRQASLHDTSVEYMEGRGLRIFRKALGIPFMIILVVYILNPQILAWAVIPLSPWLQWLGVVLGVASIPLIWWVHRSLGIHFSTTLHMREDHRLITHGPYRWVRHPMYTVLYLWLIAIFLITRNGLLGGFLLGSQTAILLQRVNKEEAAMKSRFGLAYRSYMRRTGRFFPRLGAAEAAEEGIDF